MKNVVLTIAESENGRVSAFADLLRREGMRISQVLEYGLIFGQADERLIEKLRRNKKIVSLQEEQQVQIAPPESPVQ